MQPIDPAIYDFAPHWHDRGGGIRIHFVDEGSGAPVVMVHGNPTWSIYYRNLIKALCGTHRCIAPDHVGMGRSDKPRDDAYAYTLANRVADLASLLDALQLQEKITLVVHDWGGMIGMAWAVDHADRIAKLVILNTAAFPLPPSKPLPWQLKLTRTALGTVLVRGFNAFSWGATKMAMHRNRMPKAVSDAYTAPYDSWDNRLATLRFVQDIPLQPGDPGFAIVLATEGKLGQFAQTPALIGWGAKDFVFDHHFLAHWRRHLPHAVLHEYADAGHYVLEDAAEPLVGLIAAFVRS